VYTIWEVNIMADAPGSDPSVLNAIGGALGGLFGGLSGLASTQAGVNAVGSLTDTGAAQVAPYNFTGAGYLGPQAQNLLGNTTGSANIGMGRINQAGNPLSFEDFAGNFNTSEGAKYLMETAAAAQDNSAAAKGGLLSGANLRAQATQQTNIAQQDLMDQYKAALAGQQQDFAQREQSYQNLYGQEAMGLQAGIAEAGTYAQGARAIGSLYQGLTSSATSSGNSFGNALSTVFGAIGKAFGFGT
jgi:hypothetical protein